MELAQWRKHLNQGGPKSYMAIEPARCEAILSGIEFGVKVDFIGERNINRWGPNPPIEEAFRPKVTAVIEADVAALKKAGPFAQQPFKYMSVSPLGAVPKKNSEKIRVVHNLSYPKHGDSVNEGIVHVDMDISSFGCAARAVRKAGRGCFLVKLDVEAAYKQVPVHPDDWPLLGFQWEGKWYYERVLPFGLRSSCRLWELYASALHHMLEQIPVNRGYRSVIHYVDDFLFVVEFKAEAQLLLEGALCLCRTLGLPMAESKTEGPCTKLIFLGIELDTVEMRASLPDAKLAELNELTSFWVGRQMASIEELQSLAGMLNFACQVVRPGRFYLRRVINHTTRLQRFARSASTPYKVPKEVRDDVMCWKIVLNGWNGTSLLYDAEWIEADKLELFTDACNTGWGAVFGKQWLCGAWSPLVLEKATRMKRLSMPYLELRALVLAVTAWGPQWARRKIIFRSDCMPVVQAVSKGSSRQEHSMKLLRILIQKACIYNFDFKCVHIKGVENTAADLLSRHGADALQMPEFIAKCPAAHQQYSRTEDHHSELGTILISKNSTQSA